MCGVFGIYAPDRDVARLAYFALYALQHRGQESAGIAVCDGRARSPRADIGLVAQVFDEGKLQALSGARGDRARALLDHRLGALAELAADRARTARAARSRSATTATSRTPTSCARS